MKKIPILFVFVFTLNAFGQFKDSGFPTTSVYDGIVNTQSNSLFGFLNSDNFQMRHSYQMSLSTFGGQSLALGAYTNSIFYKFSNKLNFQLSTSIVMSPYSSLGKNFQNSFNGIYINNAQINYKPWKNVDVMLQYSQLPPGYYYSPYSYYGYGNSLLNGFGFNGWNNQSPYNTVRSDNNK